MQDQLNRIEQKLDALLKRLKPAKPEPTKRGSLTPETLLPCVPLGKTAGKSSGLIYRECIQRVGRYSEREFYRTLNDLHTAGLLIHDAGSGTYYRPTPAEVEIDL